MIDGKVDYRIRNPYDVPLLVNVLFPEKTTIRVELLGLEPIYEVRHSVSREMTDGFARRIYFKEEQPLGSFEQKQKGREGMDVTSLLSITDQRGKKSYRRYSSRYYPVPEVFWVGPGVQASDLPALPEGAQGVWLEGQDAPLPNSAHGSSDEAKGLAEELPPLRVDSEQVEL